MNPAQDQSGVFFSTIWERYVAPLLALIAPLGWVALPIGVVLVFMLYSGRYIMKGAGQYGIIEGFVGTIGAGKTTLAVQQALFLARARGAVLLANIPVRCGRSCGGSGFTNGPALCGPKCKLPHEHVTTWCNVEHDTLPMTDDGLDLSALTVRAFALRDAKRGLVLLMDEVGVIMPARLWKDFSVALMWVLQQSRKLACEWIWTAQDPSFVDHQLRSLTAAVHYVRAVPPPSIWRRVKGKRPWVMFVASYTPSYAPRANGEGERKDRRLGRRFVRYRRSWEGAFDTDGVVMPSKHLKGAEGLLAAVESSHDAHVIRSGLSDWGPLEHGSADPGASIAEQVPGAAEPASEAV